MMLRPFPLEGLDHFPCEVMFFSAEDSICKSIQCPAFATPLQVNREPAKAQALQ